MPSLRPTGGLLTRQAGPNEIDTYDVLGNVKLRIIGGVVSGVFNHHFLQNSASATSNHVDNNNYSTGMGSGNSGALWFTPQQSTSAQVTVTFTLQSNGTAFASGNVGIYRGANANPKPAANLSVGTDTLIGLGSGLGVWAVGFESVVTMSVKDTGLTIGGQYEWYLAYNQNQTNGVFVVFNAAFSVMEL
jgi:hypothetical protein